MSWNEHFTKGAEALEAKQFSQAEEHLAEALKTLGPEPGHSEELAKILTNFGAIRYERGQMKEAAVLFERSLLTYEALKHWEGLNAMASNLAQTFKNLRQPERAQELYKRLSGLLEKELGADNEETATAIWNYGVICCDNGDFKLANTLFEKAFNIFEAKGDAVNFKKKAALLTNMLEAYRRQGKMLDTEPYCKKLLAIFEEGFGPSHVKVAETLCSLGVIAFEKNDYPEAESLFERALTIYDEADDPSHVAAMLYNLAQVYTKQGDTTKVGNLTPRIELIYAKNGSPSADKAGEAFFAMGKLHYQNNEWSEAMPHLDKALPLLKDAHGDKHAKVGDVLMIRGACAFNLEQYEDARKDFEEALGLFEALGDINALAATFNNIVQSYKKQDRIKDAFPIIARVIPQLESAAGKDSKAIADTFCNLGVVYFEQELYNEAKAFFTKGYLMYQSKLGREHPDVVAIQLNLAQTYIKQERYAKAKPILKNALAILERKMGRDHPAVIRVLWALAEVYRKSDRPVKAEPLEARALKLEAQEKERLRKAEASKKTVLEIPLGKSK